MSKRDLLDLEELQGNSNIVFFDDNETEAQAIMSVFSNVQFTYENGRINGYHYVMLKDLIKFEGLKPKNYIKLINVMFSSFRKHLPKK